MQLKSQTGGVRQNGQCYRLSLEQLYLGFKIVLNLAILIQQRLEHAKNTCRDIIRDHFPLLIKLTKVKFTDCT